MKMGQYMVGYFDELPLGSGEHIVELDAMWFGANKQAPAANHQAAFRPRKCIWGIVERHHNRFRCWLIDGENREGWMPLFDRFVDK